MAVQTVQILGTGLGFGDVDVKACPGKPIRIGLLIIAAQHQDGAHGVRLLNGQLNE